MGEWLRSFSLGGSAHAPLLRKGLGIYQIFQASPRAEWTWWGFMRMPRYMPGLELKVPMKCCDAARSSMEANRFSRWEWRMGAGSLR